MTSQATTAIYRKPLLVNAGLLLLPGLAYLHMQANLVAYGNNMYEPTWDNVFLFRGLSNSQLLVLAFFPHSPLSSVDTLWAILRHVVSGNIMLVGLPAHWNT